MSSDLYHVELQENGHLRTKDRTATITSDQWRQLPAFLFSLSLLSDSVLSSTCHSLYFTLPTLPILEVFLCLNVRSRWSFIMFHQCHTRISINIYWKNKRTKGGKERGGSERWGEGEERKRGRATIKICLFKGRISGFLSSLDHVHRPRSTWEGSWEKHNTAEESITAVPQGVTLCSLDPVCRDFPPNWLYNFSAYKMIEIKRHKVTIPGNKKRLVQSSLWSWEFVTPGMGKIKLTPDIHKLIS